jgi:hypothetical protein
MKHIAAITFCLFVAANAAAQDNSNTKQQTSPGLAHPLATSAASQEDGRQSGQKDRWGIGISVDALHFSYKEPGVMEEKGWMIGMSGDYTFHLNNFMFKAEGRFGIGSVDYSSEESGKLNDIADYILETRFVSGYDFNASGSVQLTPFTGLGYRYLFDDGSGKLTDLEHGMYDRKARYLYTPIGLESLFGLGSGWRLGATGEYDLFWRGWQRSRVNDVHPGYGPLDNTQKEGWGARASARITKEFEKLDFYIEPYFIYWDIEISDTDILTFYDVPIGDAWEPPNTSREWGARVGIRF